MLEGQRRAIIVGINKYEDKNIPELGGAENDAKELRERLNNPHIGNFEVLDRHFLLGKDATCKKIRQALSDVFWKTDTCDLALFYFSGHGFVDDGGVGYIAPYDMCKNDPFVCGIDMNELRGIISRSKQIPSVIMILDSCHSGIATTDKSISNLDDQYDKNLQHLSQGTENRFVFASSAGEEVSREQDVKHHDDAVPHRHGTYTFHLLNALDGAAGGESGIIGLLDLQDYLDAQFKKVDAKQKPKCYIGEASRIRAIHLASAKDKAEKYVLKQVTEAERCSEQTNLASLIQATRLITEVLSLSPKHDRANGLKQKLGPIIADQQPLVDHWLSSNERPVRSALPVVFPALEDLVSALDFDKISTLLEREETLLIQLHRVANGEIPLDRFITRCKPFDRPESQTAPIPQQGAKGRLQSPLESSQYGSQSQGGATPPRR